MRLIRPPHAVIDLDAISGNIRRIRQIIGPKVKLLAVVKADAYGHGLIQTARTAVAAGVDQFGVANLDEGCALRQAGVQTPVLVMGASLAEQVSELIRFRLTPMVCSIDLAQALSAQARSSGLSYPVHIKIDVGMGRLGIPVEEAIPFLRKVNECTGLFVEGLFTHFPCADEADKHVTRYQTSVFNALLNEMDHLKIRPPVAHAANSGAILDHPDSHFDMVRPGLILYGYYPSEAASRTIPLRPSLTWKTRVVFLKTVPAGTGLSYGLTYVTPCETVVATLPVGYEDGYVRALSNRGNVLIAGKRAPVIGRVCMDQILVDVTAIPGVTVGDEVVLIGRQSDAEISVETFARKLGTVPNEIVCQIDKRVPRVYLREGIQVDD